MLWPRYPDLQTKKTAAGFGVVPEGFLLQLEREINALPPEMLDDVLLKQLQGKFGVDDLVFSGNDTYIFAHAPPGTEEHNFGLSQEVRQWAMPPGPATDRIKLQYEAARRKGGRLVVFAVGKFDPTNPDKHGKIYGVFQVTGRPQEQMGAGALPWLGGGARGAPFTVRWLHAFAHRDLFVATNPDCPWTESRCDPRIPASDWQARIVLDICRYRKLHPERQMDLHGKPLESDLPSTLKKRKRGKGTKESPEDDDDVDHGPQHFDALLDGWEHEGEEDKDDDADKYVYSRFISFSFCRYEGAVVLQTITGLYNVPISTLDFASLYPSLIILHNLCVRCFPPLVYTPYTCYSSLHSTNIR